jgi:hypothetical protein
MTQHQNVGTVGCLAVLAAFDLRVSPAQADAHDVDEHLALGGLWFRDVAHGAGARATRYDRERTHGRSI